MSSMGDTQVAIPHPWTVHMWRWRKYLIDNYGFVIGEEPEDCMWCVDATRNQPDVYIAFCAIERMQGQSKPHGA